ncbi:MAG: cytoplasmic protein [Candidatus Marinimicrobia bacterium]|jgi:hypothetical protein|nr:cytoplasmic protein [Candidatus Neomarinimicrobiota bacterium]
MKHLFITFSILILSSFLASCEKKEETLFGSKTSTGWEWKTTGDKNINPHYKGEVKREHIIFGDYIIEGLGSLTYPDGIKYVGEFKDGKEHGQGTVTHLNGDTYAGEWKDGSPAGQGTETLADGRKYVGEFKDGLPNGRGIEIRYDDGFKFEGDWKDGNWWNGTRYDNHGNIIGKWVNGLSQ